MPVQSSIMALPYIWPVGGDFIQCSPNIKVNFSKTKIYRVLRDITYQRIMLFMYNLFYISSHSLINLRSNKYFDVLQFVTVKSFQVLKSLICNVYIYIDDKICIKKIIIKTEKYRNNYYKLYEFSYLCFRINSKLDLES